MANGLSLDKLIAEIKSGNFFKVSPTDAVAALVETQQRVTALEGAVAQLIAAKK